MELRRNKLSIDYRVLFVVVFLLAGIGGYLMERLLYGQLAEEAASIVSDYMNTVITHEADKWQLFRHLSFSYGKSFLVLLALSFTAAGLPVTAYCFLLYIFRHSFFLAAMLRQYTGSSAAILLAGCILPSVLSFPVFFYCFRFGYEGFSYCIQNNARFCRFTKKQLQNLLKLGIIILLVLVLGALTESYLCTFFLHQAAQ